MANDPGLGEAENRRSKNPLRGWIQPLLIGFVVGTFETQATAWAYGFSIRNELPLALQNGAALAAVFVAIHLAVGLPLALTRLGAGSCLHRLVTLMAGVALLGINHGNEAQFLKDWIANPSQRLVIAAATPAGIGLALYLLAYRMKKLRTALMVIGLSMVALVLKRGSGSADPDWLQVAAHEQPNVIMVVIDTLRADHLSCYGHTVDGLPTSPKLDAIAEEGVRFHQAYAQAPWTRPSVASLMTGLYPQSHGVATPFDRVPESLPTLAALLQGQGYHCSAFSANPQVSSDFGFDRGFDHFWSINNSLDSLLTGGRIGHKLDASVRRLAMKLSGSEHPNLNRGIPNADADRVNREFKNWATGQYFVGPRFHYIHYLDPHDPYTAPVNLLHSGAGDENLPESQGPRADLSPHPAEEFLLAPVDHPPFPVTGYAQNALPEDERQDLMRRYDEEIRFVDDRLGNLLAWMTAEKLYRPQQDLLIITSDHGEEFYEHQQWLHGRSEFEEMVRVPLIIKAPWLEPGRVHQPPVQLVDLLPSIAKWLEIEVNFEHHGESLSAPAKNRPIYSHRPRDVHPIDMVRLNNHKLIAVGDGADTYWLLYDLEADPKERRNLWGQMEELQEQLIHLMRGFQAKALAARPVGESRTELNQRLEDQLRALGYLDKK